MSELEALPLKACPCCGLVQHVPALAEGARARCQRCHTTISNPGRRRGSNEQARLAALAALIIYPLAITLPIMRLERFGHLREASIWSGSVGLLREGEIFVGGIVLLCSIVIPLFKLFGLLAITSGAQRLSRRHKAITYRVIEIAGRWGMLDVLLISVVVAWIKMGDLVDVSPGPAALTFTMCVLLSLFASARFDPHALWER